jgi:hypothetical protein
MNRFFTEVATRKLLTVRAILTGWTLWSFTATNVWHELLMSYLGLSGKGLTLIWTGWMSHRWVYSAVPALFIWSYCCLIGWLVGRLHPAAPVQMVTSFTIFLCLFEGGHIVAEAQNPNAFAGVIVVWACRDIGAILSVVVGGILAARAKHQSSRLKAWLILAAWDS